MWACDVFYAARFSWNCSNPTRSERCVGSSPTFGNTVWGRLLHQVRQSPPLPFTETCGDGFDIHPRREKQRRRGEPPRHRSSADRRSFSLPSRTVPHDARRAIVGCTRCSPRSPTDATPATLPADTRSRSQVATRSARNVDTLSAFQTSVGRFETRGLPTVAATFSDAARATTAACSAVRRVVATFDAVAGDRPASKTRTSAGVRDASRT